MASIDSGGRGGRRKVVDHEIPLVPFIDLLLCCVMFLLVTAVWAQLGQMDANVPGTVDGIPGPETHRLDVTVSAEGYVLRSSIGTEVAIPRVEGEYDMAALQQQLERHRLDTGNPTPVHLQPDDGVGMGTIAATMDVLRGEGFVNIGFPGAA